MSADQPATVEIPANYHESAKAEYAQILDLLADESKPVADLLRARLTAIGGLLHLMPEPPNA